MDKKPCPPISGCRGTLPGMLKRVGFFHFGTGHGDPIGSLKAALLATSELNISSGPAQADREPETLIVLPEAFKIKKPS